MSAGQRFPSLQAASPFAERARDALQIHPPRLDGSDDPLAIAGDHVLAPGFMTAEVAMKARPAAVLIPVVARDAGEALLLTRRSMRLRDHAGQIAFPGGKIDAGDATPWDAALREAREEIGLEPDFVEPIGFLDPYLTGSGFRVLGCVGLVRPGFSLTPDPNEVDEAFEVPLAFLMNPDNHRVGEKFWKGQIRRYYEMPYENRYIWGVTAGIIRRLYERVYGIV